MTIIATCRHALERGKAGRDERSPTPQSPSIAPRMQY